MLHVFANDWIPSNVTKPFSFNQQEIIFDKLCLVLEEYSLFNPFPHLLKETCCSLHFLFSPSSLYNNFVLLIIDDNDEFVHNKQAHIKHTFIAGLIF